VRALQVEECGSLLPSDGTPVEVTMHDADGSFYITDVKPKK